MNNFQKLCRLANVVLDTLPDRKIDMTYVNMYIDNLNDFAATAPYHLHSDHWSDQHFCVAYGRELSSMCRFSGLVEVPTNDEPFIVGIQFCHAFPQTSEYGSEVEDGWANITAVITINGIEVQVEVDNVWVEPPPELEGDDAMNYVPTEDETEWAKDQAAESVRQVWDGWFNEETE